MTIYDLSSKSVLLIRAYAVRLYAHTHDDHNDYLLFVNLTEIENELLNVGSRA